MKLTIVDAYKDKHTFIEVKEVTITRSNGFIRVHFTFNNGDKWSENKVRSVEIKEEV